MASHLKKVDRAKLQVHTLEEVGRHNQDDDAWVVIDRLVIDVTEYNGEHPGGPEILAEHFGRDATRAFVEQNHSSTAFRQLVRNVIGKLPDDDTAGERLSDFNDEDEAQGSGSSSVLPMALFAIGVIGLLYYRFVLQPQQAAAAASDGQ